jgi:hypothetical protein
MRGASTTLAGLCTTAVLAAPAAMTMTAASVNTAQLRAPDQCAPAGVDAPGAPWTQQLLAPDRVWPMATGRGIRIALLGSGVDAGHQQLAGRVEPGIDVLAGGGRADSDCLGSGTQAAGVIAGSRDTPAGFTGFAPDALIVPVRVTTAGLQYNQAVAPDALAAGVRAATQAGVDVIDVTVATYVDDAGLRTAVADALAANIVVVAAVGDVGAQGGASAAPPTPYPAGYPGVIGVGAVDQAVQRWEGSPPGRYVALVAPGAAVVTLQRGRGLTVVNGTGIASAFVAASAALVRQRRPLAGAAEVVRLLEATAVPVDGPNSLEYGHGLVNPYAAVTTELVAAPEAPAPPAWPDQAAAPKMSKQTIVAIAGAVASAIGVVIMVVAAAAVPRARRRHWRPSLAPALPPDPEPADPGPPLMLFDEE